MSDYVLAVTKCSEDLIRGAEVDTARGRQRVRCERSLASGDQLQDREPSSEGEECLCDVLTILGISFGDIDIGGLTLCRLTYGGGSPAAYPARRQTNDNDQYRKRIRQNELGGRARPS